MTDESFAMVVEFHAAPGRADDLRRALLAVVGPTRAEDGCLRYDLHEDLADPAVLAFYEVWASPEHHASHDASDHIGALRGVIGDLVDAPIRVLRLRRIEPTG